MDIFFKIYGTDMLVEELDLVVIGGGVAGYVAAIKAGQAGLKVRHHISILEPLLMDFRSNA